MSFRSVTNIEIWWDSVACIYQILWIWFGWEELTLGVPYAWKWCAVVWVVLFSIIWWKKNKHGGRDRHTYEVAEQGSGSPSHLQLNRPGVVKWIRRGLNHRPLGSQRPQEMQCSKIRYSNVLQAAWAWIPWNLSFRYIHCTGQFTPKMKANAEPRLLSSLVWIDSGVVV